MSSRLPNLAPVPENGRAFGSVPDERSPMDVAAYGLLSQLAILIALLIVFALATRL